MNRSKSRRSLIFCVFRFVLLYGRIKIWECGVPGVLRSCILQRLGVYFIRQEELRAIKETGYLLRSEM